jgi:hypothetical protein
LPAASTAMAVPTVLRLLKKQPLPAPQFFW